MKKIINDYGQIKRWPKKDKDRQFIMNLLAEKFKQGIIYSEKKINGIIESSHIFDDIALLRRELISRKKLARKNDGSEYWKI